MAKKLEWRPVGGLVAVVERDGRKLMVSVTSVVGSTWSVLAIETTQKTQTADDVFADHAHVSVAEEIPLGIGMTLAEIYAEAWLAKDVEALEQCRCEGVRVSAEALAARPPELDFPELEMPPGMEPV